MGHPNMNDVIQLYQMKIAPLSSAQRDKLYQADEQGVTPFAIGCAILRACQQQQTQKKQGKIRRVSFNYVWAIIQDWLAHGLVTEDALKDYWQQQAHLGREKHVENGYRKFVRNDFTYTTPREHQRGSFDFLED